jgi:hypothetical protein
VAAAILGKSSKLPDALLAEGLPGDGLPLEEPVLERRFKGELKPTAKRRLKLPGN